MGYGRSWSMVAVDSRLLPIDQRGGAASRAASHKMRSDVAESAFQSRQGAIFFDFGATPLASRMLNSTAWTKTN
jgi:hypothetical protein